MFFEEKVGGQEGNERIDRGESNDQEGGVLGQDTVIDNDRKNIQDNHPKHKRGQFYFCKKGLSFFPESNWVVFEEHDKEHNEEENNARNE